MSRLVLFDVDLTLISPARSHRRAFIEAIQEIYGIDPRRSGVNYHGMTDPQIVREVLMAKGLGSAAIEASLPRCLARMVEIFENHLPHDDFSALKGVTSLLPQLHKNGVILGLVTGGLEPIAWQKMERIGVRHYFNTGAFGSDHHDRNFLVPLAITRAAQAMRKGDQKVWVVGDTPRDIEAAHYAQVQVLSVASGAFTAQQLREAGADAVVEDLSDPLVETLLGGS